MRIWDNAYSSYYLEMCNPKQDEDSNTNKRMKEERNIQWKKNPESEKLVFLMVSKDWYLFSH